MVDLENQLHLECIICKDTTGVLRSRNEFFQECTCQQVVFHDKCWHDFVNSEHGESCPTCRKAFNVHMRSLLKPVMLIPQLLEENQRGNQEHKEQHIRNEEVTQSCFRKSLEFYLFFIHGLIFLFCVLSITNESTDLQIQIILIIQSFYSTYNYISSFIDFFRIPHWSTILDVLQNIENRFRLLSHTIRFPASIILRCMCSCTSFWSILASGRIALYIVMLMVVNDVSSFKFAHTAFIMQIGELSAYILFAIACSVIAFFMRCYDIIHGQY